MNQSSEMLLIGSVAIVEAEGIKSELANMGIGIEIAVNPKACAGGACSTKAELWANTEDFASIQRFFTDRHAKLLEGHALDPAICPACACQFKTSLGECPDCGLVFAVLESSGGCK
ncbi:MAG: hypothetical protein NTV34_04070 [Proteobacteria bacterium]|nr:hypothetical protein [Pseudomonadota bacterium]